MAINWAYKMRNKADVYLFTHLHDVNMPKVMSRRVDLSEQESIKEVLTDWRPDMVIHTAGMTNVDGCEKDPKEARIANVKIARQVAAVANELDLKLVHISTDHLFDGNKPLVSEEEPPAPLNVYGETKLEAEIQVLDVCPDALVVRTNFYGWGHPDRTSFTDWIIHSLQRGESIPAFYDVFFSPVLIDHLIIAVHGLVERGVSGIIHVAGDQRISKYDFALTVADIFSLDKQLIKKASIKKAKLLAPRPLDMSLSSQKAVSLLGRKIGNVEGGLQGLFEQLQQGRPRELALAICQSDLRGT